MAVDDTRDNGCLGSVVLMRAIARALREVVRAARFRAWAARLRFELWRQGGRLEIEAPHGVHFDSAPNIRAFPSGNGDGLLRLRIGRDVRLGRNMTIEVFAQGNNELAIGDGARFLANVRITLRSGTLLLGSDCLVRDGAWIKVDGTLSVGNGVTVGPYSAVHCADQITLDDLVGLGERVSLIDSDHTFDGSDIHYMLKPISTSPVHLQRQTMVAMGSVVLRGALIGPNSVVAANSVVRGGNYLKGSLLAGNPAKVLKILSPEGPEVC